jgi:hypothetical protein
MSRSTSLALSVGLFALLAVDVACVGAHEPPEPSDDPSIPTGAVASATSTGSGGGAATTATTTSGSGGAGGAATTAGTGGAPPFTPDCVCLRARAADVMGCSSCCRSCYDAAELACQAETDACAADVNGCQVAVDLAKACPADASYETCLATAFDLTPSLSQSLAQAVLDCGCGACVAECGAGDTCP